MNQQPLKPDATLSTAAASPRLFAQLGTRLGPGILFAASSVGTSHLVQSTRAGADYGFSLLALILLACLLKYPAFRFGTDYAAATGTTLIEAYFRQGRWSVAVYIIEVLVTMIIAASAVAVVTAGLLSSVLGLSVSVKVVACGLLVLCALVLASGKYLLFEKITKNFVALFMLLIITAVALTVGEIGATGETLLPAIAMERNDLLFMIALAGWMPTVVGASVWQSLWVCAKSREIGRPLSLAEARFDFNLGYIMTLVLAMCFMFLGAVLMFQHNVAVADTSTEFAAQLINLFTQSIGEFAYPLIALAAVAVMLSTLLTIMDGCPRAVGSIIANFGEAAPSDTEPSAPTIESIEHSFKHESQYFLPLLLLQVVAPIAVILFFMSSFKTFIDFATSVAFLTAPIIAFMNHRAMFSSAVDQQFRPGKLIRGWSWLGMVTMAAFGLFYVFYGVLG